MRICLVSLSLYVLWSCAFVAYVCVLTLRFTVV